MTAPGEVAAAILRAADAGDWAAVAVLVDPEAAEQFAAGQREQHRTHEAFEASEGRHAGMPPEVAAWFDRGPRLSFVQLVYGVAAAADLERLPASAIVERFLRAKHSGRRAAADGSAAGGEANRPRVPLGEVREGEDLSHVVFRRPHDWPERADWDAVDLLTMRRTVNGWRCMLNGGLVYDSGGGYAVGLSGPADESAADSGDDQPEAK